MYDVKIALKDFGIIKINLKTSAKAFSLLNCDELVMDYTMNA